MQLEQLNSHASQTYLLTRAGGKQAVIIDPVLEQVDEYIGLLAKRGLTLQFVIDTHTHGDHVSGGPALADRCGCRYVMQAAALAGCVDLRVEDGYKLQADGIELSFIHTPGHSPDSVCIAAAPYLFTGDTLLLDDDGIGRDDILGGNSQEHWHSLQRLKELPDAWLVCPAHRYCQHQPTTLGEQKRRNRFLTVTNFPDYLKVAAVAALAPSDHQGGILAANFNCSQMPQAGWSPQDMPACPVKPPRANSIETQPVFSITPQEIKQKLDHGWQGMVLDVREAEELQGPLGHLPGVRHIRLGELAARLGELDGWQDREITIVCRTGPRAHTAAQILRYGGFNRLVIMEGGMVQWQVLGYPASRDL